jgi:hypothetical protein
MGLTIYYDWKAKSDLTSARRMIAKFNRLALSLPFDEVTEIYEQDPPDDKPAFSTYCGTFRKGDLYLPRRRSDGDQETVHVPALHAVFFSVRVEGAESASIGLASVRTLFSGEKTARNGDDSSAKDLRSSFQRGGAVIIRGIRAAKLNMLPIPGWAGRPTFLKPTCR